MRKKVILITGASRGLGLAFSKKFSEFGFEVIGAVRCQADADRLNEGNLAGLGMRFIKCDVTLESDIDALKLELVSMGGVLDILVNNAGILPDNDIQGIFSDNSLLNTSIEKIMQAIEVNMIGPIRIIKSLLPLMISTENGEKKIINISSQAGQLSSLEWGIPAYSLSKVGLNAVTKLVATEFGEKGIICVSVSPGWVKTDMGGSCANIEINEAADEFFRLVMSLTSQQNGSFLRNAQPIQW